MKLVEINNLFFNYQEKNVIKNVLKNINLDIEENEKIILIGENGAGKSTLLKLIAGIHIVKDFKHFSVLNEKIPQDLCNGLAYLGNRWERTISFCGNTPYIADIAVKDMMKNWQNDYLERRDELVNVLKIDLNWRMHTVSDGQRKKVQIMLALLKPFKLLVIDEFLNDLDVIVRNNFFNYLNKECAERKASIIYATHIFDNLKNNMNKVLFIKNGECSEKIDIENFDNQHNLFESVKNKLLE